MQRVEHKLDIFLYELNKYIQKLCRYTVVTTALLIDCKA